MARIKSFRFDKDPDSQRFASMMVAALSDNFPPLDEFERERDEVEPEDDRPTIEVPRGRLMSVGMTFFDERGNRVLPSDNSESTNDRHVDPVPLADRAEDRSDEVLRYDGSERRRR